MYKTDFFTQLNLSKSSIDITYRDTIMTIGSCFAESIGQRLADYKFDSDINPFGILYNPASIANAIRKLQNPVAVTTDQLLHHEGIYHSFDHHSNFSAIAAEECLHKINTRLEASSKLLKQASKLFITFGTAFVYKLKSSGTVVSNCHKLPSHLFRHERLSLSEITAEWEELLAILLKQNNRLQVIFTVSPIRYLKDGAHQNQISKSILLLAIEHLQNLFSDRVHYFPAYELMMDELRDYRFYADDMCHPTEFAIAHIWKCFHTIYMNDETTTLMKEIDTIRRAMQHKPFNPHSEGHRRFLSQTLLMVEQLSRKTPYLCFEKELKQLKNSLQY